MDLDNMKKAWNDDEFIPAITQENIQNIIHKKEKTALSQLLWFEIIGLIMVLPFMAAPYIHALYFPRAPYPEFTKWFFMSTCIISFFWQLYKVRLLKNIDLKQDNILLSLKTISTYKLYIKREFIVGVAFLCIILGSFFYGYVGIISDQGKLSFCIYNLIVLVIACFIMLVFYRLFYKKNIRKIESALDEVKEMEEDN